MDISFLIDHVNKLKSILTAAQYYLEAIPENEHDPRVVSKARACIAKALEFKLPEPYLQELLGDLYMKEGQPILAHFAYLEAYKQTRDSKIRDKLVESWMLDWKQRQEYWSPIVEEVERATIGCRYGDVVDEKDHGEISSMMKDSENQDNLRVYGDLLSAMGKHEYAVEIYEKAYCLEPTSLGTGRRLIGAYMECDRRLEASKVYDDLKDIHEGFDPNISVPGVLMAYRRMEEGKYLEAARYLESEMCTVNSDKVLLEALEEIYAHLGEYGKAKNIRSRIKTG
jgi:tetratricopeptide (TPR) repeat protein